jgi:hypothetical protein
MNASRFDALTRSLTGTAFSRRRLLRGAAGSAIGVMAVSLGAAEAGATLVSCVQVGKRCKRSGQCCSGHCRGPKGKKTCRAHNVGTCTATQNFCSSATDLCGGGQCGCTRTTGGASFCSKGGSLINCTKDAECAVALDTPGAACVVFAGSGCTPEGNRCALPCPV